MPQPTEDCSISAFANQILGRFLDTGVEEPQLETRVAQRTDDSKEDQASLRNLLNGILESKLSGKSKLAYGRP